MKKFRNYCGNNLGGVELGNSVSKFVRKKGEFLKKFTQSRYNIWQPKIWKLLVELSRKSQNMEFGKAVAKIPRNSLSKQS